MIFLNASTVVAGSLLLAVSPIAETFEFTPKAGTTIVRTLKLKKNTEVDTATLSLMDQEMEAGGGMTISGTSNVRIVDVLGKVDEGRIMDFVRTYETIVDDSSSEGSGEGIEVRGADGEASDLEGQEVNFVWDAEEETYVPQYTGDEPGEEEWLAGLAVSLDLVNWLPGTDVSVGEKWELSLDELASVIWYGGRLYPLAAEDSGEGPEGSLSISVPDFSDIQALSGSEGEIHLTLERLDEEDGNRIAIVTFELKGTVDQDLSEQANALSDARGSSQTFDAADQSMEMSGSGELRWDLKAGRLVSLTLDLEQDIEEVAEWSMSAHGTDLEITFSTTKARTYHIELAIEEVTEDE